MLVLPVIMSGGSGTRLWPASTPERPKQFHALGSTATMLQDTSTRVQADGFLDALAICNHRHAELVVEQFASSRLAGVILEPFGRNTAAVGVVAALWAQRHAPGALVLLMPADHVVADIAGFRSAVRHAAPAATERIITFGITPAAPETGYGYIQSGDPLYDGIYKVRRFVEKPDRTVAQSYLDEGGYSWNAGIFLYDPAVFLAEASRLCPEVTQAATAALDAAEDLGRNLLLLNPDEFAKCPSEPIDVAVMEKTDKGAVLPCDIGWADIGSWSELWRHGSDHDEANVTRGDTLAIDSKGSLLWSDGPSISVIGVDDLIVVATKEHVLVLPKGRAQDVKRLVEMRSSAEPR